MPKILRNIGIVASAAGAVITWYGYTKYSDAKSMIGALRDGDSLFGTSSDKSINIWSEHSNNYKLILIIGAIILICGIILLLSGLMSGKNTSEVLQKQEISVNADNTADISERLKKLNELKKEGLISEEEYEEKRKSLISSL